MHIYNYVIVIIVVIVVVVIIVVIFIVIVIIINKILKKKTGGSRKCHMMCAYYLGVLFGEIVFRFIESFDRQTAARSCPATGKSS